MFDPTGSSRGSQFKESNALGRKTSQKKMFSKGFPSQRFIAKKVYDILILKKITEKLRRD